MSVLSQLASSLKRRDEIPNQLLAEKIVRTRNHDAVKELVENLENRDRNIQSDCMKVLYEIGERKPVLIRDYVDDFAALLKSSNQRLVWGAMTALDAITNEKPAAVYHHLPNVLAAAEGESVIARDHAIGILVKLGAMKPYRERCFGVLLEQLKNCPDNQLAMYAEMSAPIIPPGKLETFVKVVSTRARGLPKESQKKRVAKLLKRLT